MNVLENFMDGAIYQQFLTHLEKKYPETYHTFTDEVIQDKFEIIFLMGLRKAKEFYNQNQSCNLLFHDKPPRADMVSKLGNILFELQKFSTYPIVPASAVVPAIKKVLSSRDKRTRDRYLHWIKSLSNSERIFNKCDLTNITRQFPDEKIIQGGIW